MQNSRSINLYNWVYIINITAACWNNMAFYWPPLFFLFFWNSLWIYCNTSRSSLFKLLNSKKNCLLGPLREVFTTPNRRYAWVCVASRFSKTLSLVRSVVRMFDPAYRPQITDKSVYKQLNVYPFPETYNRWVLRKLKLSIFSCFILQIDKTELG